MHPAWYGMGAGLQAQFAERPCRAACVYISLHSWARVCLCPLRVVVHAGLAMQHERKLLHVVWSPLQSCGSNMWASHTAGTALYMFMPVWIFAQLGPANAALQDELSRSHWRRQLAN
jgi:hypothetical protein